MFGPRGHAPYAFGRARGGVYAVEFYPQCLGAGGKADYAENDSE